MENPGLLLAVLVRIWQQVELDVGISRVTPLTRELGRGEGEARSKPLQPSKARQHYGLHGMTHQVSDLLY